MHSRLAALRCLLGFDVAPAGYRDDVTACLGLTGEVTARELYAAARRLADGTLELVQSHESTLTTLAPEHAGHSLRDLYRHVAHALALPDPAPTPPRD